MKDVVEVWRPVYEFPMYDVSNKGRVRSWRVRGHANGVEASPRIIRASACGRGYLHVALTKLGRRHFRLVHRLVADAFIGECPDGLTVNHRNEDKRDNRAENLEYITLGDNVRYGTGVARSRETRRVIMTERYGKPVILRSPSGQVVGFPSRCAAAREIGVSHGSLFNLVSGAVGSAHGWKIVDNSPIALPERM